MSLTALGVKEMVININDIPPQGLTLKLGQPIDLFDTGTKSTSFTAVFSIKPMKGGILHISGQVKAQPLLECSRCLERFTFDIDTELNFDLAPINSIDTDGEYELVSGEMDMEFYDGDEIEPLDIIKEQLMISIPMVPLHNTRV